MRAPCLDLFTRLVSATPARASSRAIASVGSPVNGIAEIVAGRRRSPALPLPSAPRGARRRSPSPRSVAPPANPGRPSARAGQAPQYRAALAGLSLDRRAIHEEAGPRAEAGRPGGGTEARRRAVDRAGNPPRERRGGGGDRARRDSRAWWGPLVPSGGCDVPAQTGARSPENGSRGLGGGAPAVAPAGSCGSGQRPPRHDHRDRAASPPGSRRTPAVHPWSETEKQVKVLRGRTDAWTTIPDLQPRV